MGLTTNALTTNTVLMHGIEEGSCANLLLMTYAGGMSVDFIVRALFADPWPEGVVSNVLMTLRRRMRCTPSIAEMVLDLVVGLATTAPSRVLKDQLQILFDGAPG